MQGCLTMIRTASTVDNCKIIQLFENEWCFTYVNLYIDNKFDMLKCRILSEKFRWANILFPAWEQTNAVEIFKTLLFLPLCLFQTDNRRNQKLPKRDFLSSSLYFSESLFISEK